MIERKRGEKERGREGERKKEREGERRDGLKSSKKKIF